jgi:hypothetical protein
MHDPDREARYGPDEERAMLALAASDDVEQRRGSAYCLGDVKAPSLATLDVLFALCASDDAETARSAVSSVAQIADRFEPSPVEALLEATRHEAPRVREAAIHGLGNARKMGDADRARAVERLIALLDDPDDRVLAAACENIGYFAHGDARARIVPKLLGLLQGRPRAIPDEAREPVIQSLGNAYLGAPSQAPHDVKEAIRKETSHPNPKVASIARWASTVFDRTDPPRAPSAGTSEEVLTVPEAQRRLDELDAWYKKTGRLFMTGAVALLVAIGAAFWKPPIAVVAGIVAVVSFVAWSKREKNAPPPTAHMQAQLALARAQLGHMKQMLDARAPKED